ncbi:hypothetical protein QFZ28_004002 [Neobacillus niacini]|nr:hypothetical protein [Neobacillus niacini]MDQ1003602.1 hypothetical protein [Neobacillus niacini]
MADDKLRQKLRAKLGIKSPSPKPFQSNKSISSLQVQPARKGCCGKKV